jgi:DedD protein
MKPLLRGLVLAALLVSIESARADWVVQIAAFADSVFLRQMVESIRKAGFPVTTEPLANPDGPSLTRLLAGPFDTKAEAEAAAVRLAAHGWPGYLKQRTEARKPAPRPTPASPAPTPSRRAS